MNLPIDPDPEMHTTRELLLLLQERDEAHSQTWKEWRRLFVENEKLRAVLEDVVDFFGDIDDSAGESIKVNVDDMLVLRRQAEAALTRPEDDGEEVAQLRESQRRLVAQCEELAEDRRQRNVTIEQLKNEIGGLKLRLHAWAGDGAEYRHALSHVVDCDACEQCSSLADDALNCTTMGKPETT